MSWKDKNLKMYWAARGHAGVSQWLTVSSFLFHLIISIRYNLISIIIVQKYHSSQKSWRFCSLHHYIGFLFFHHCAEKRPKGSWGNGTGICITWCNQKHSKLLASGGKEKVTLNKQIQGLLCNIFMVWWLYIFYGLSYIW